MFTLVYGADLFDFPDLANQMFRDRRSQFKEGLGWNLLVDENGREVDEYDLANPLYLILKDAEGGHLASTRLLPTTGPTMIADHFSDLTDGVEIESPLIWECTRFFVARRSAESRRHAAALMWAGCQFGLRSGVQFYVGVTAAHMVRVFTACGWPAEVIGRKAGPEGEICACLWEISEEIVEAVRDRAGIAPGQYELSVYRAPAQGRAARRPSTALSLPGLPAAGPAAELARLA